MLHNGIDCQSGAPDVSLAATPDMTTTGETAEGMIRNALMIATASAMLTDEPDDRGAFRNIAHLLENALVLGVPAPQEPTT